MTHYKRWKYNSDQEAKEANRAIQKRNTQRNREFVIRAKSKPCFDCGIQYNFWVMQFDHRDPQDKKFELSQLKHSYSLNKLQAEIGKCDVVCANCHLDRTYREKHWKVRRGGLYPETKTTGLNQLVLFND